MHPTERVFYRATEPNEHPLSSEPALGDTFYLCLTFCAQSKGHSRSGSALKKDLGHGSCPSEHCGPNITNVLGVEGTRAP